jgi:ParB/RepB/Spo0J family partition protein
VSATAEAVQLNSSPATIGTIQLLPLDTIQPREDQPRQHYGEEELQALADSIAADGVRTPLRVREAPGGYDLLAGHRRRLAAIRAGLTHVPCIVEQLDDLRALEAVVADNLNRVDLLPHEEGAGLRALLHAGQSPEQVAALIGRSREYVLDRVLISTLPEDVLAKVRRGDINPSVRLLVELAKLPEKPVPAPPDPDTHTSPQIALCEAPPVDLRREMAAAVTGCGYQAASRIIGAASVRHGLRGAPVQTTALLEVERIPREAAQARAELDRRFEQLSKFREWAVENADQLGYLSPEQKRSIAQQVAAGRAALDQIAEAVRV